MKHELYDYKVPTMLPMKQHVKPAYISNVRFRLNK